MITTVFGADDFIKDWVAKRHNEIELFYLIHLYFMQVQIVQMNKLDLLLTLIINK